MVHIDLYGVDMDTKVTVKVPIIIVGQSIGVREEGGVLNQSMTEVEIECLPNDIPQHIEADISDLRAWSLSVTKDTQETTKMGDTSKSFVGGLISGEGSATLLYNPSGNSDYQAFIDDVLVTGDAGDALFELFPDSAQSAKKIGFAGGDENPLTQVYYYTKDEKNMGFRGKPQDSSFCIPAQHQELIVRMFTNSSNVAAAKKEWEQVKRRIFTNSCQKF